MRFAGVAPRHRRHRRDERCRLRRCERGAKVLHERRESARDLALLALHHAMSCALDRRREANVVDRLEQVVERVRLECLAARALSYAVTKITTGICSAPISSITPKPSMPGICTSRNTTLGACSRIGGNRLAPTRAFGNHGVPAGALEPRADAAAGELLVVDDDGADHAGASDLGGERSRIRNC